MEEALRRNPRERMKLEKHPLDVLDEIYSLIDKGYEAIPEEDVVRLQWWGLYHDKPRLGYFMVRIKLPGGILSWEQAKAIAEIAEAFGRGYIELTTRQNVQLHWIRLEDVPEVFSRLLDVGLTTAAGCGDTVRNITSCPLSGVNPEELFDVRPTLFELAEYFYGNRRYSNLPRKHKITVSSCPHQCNAPEMHCIALIGVEKEDGRKGYTIRVGGGLSSSPRISRHLPVFVELGEELEVVRAIIDVWYDMPSYRASFVRARLKFLVDDLGVEKLRILVEERLGRRLEDHPVLPLPQKRGVIDHLGVNPQKQEGLYSVGLSVTAGLLTGRQLLRLLDALGDGIELRVTQHQNLIAVNVPERELERVLRRASKLGFGLRPRRVESLSVACTGDPYCNYSVGETKVMLIRILKRLELEGLLDMDVKINLDGCPHACGQHWLGDIGLQGTTIRTPTGVKYAFDVILGGGYGLDASIGSVTARRVPAELIPGWIANLLKAYKTSGFTNFRDFIRSKSPEELVRLMGGEEGLQFMATKR
ncbi:MAG: nitrite/sulfite reductase [Nitrososphaerota archaeon]